MGGRAGGTGDAGRAAVERHVHADQVDRQVVPLVGDRERLVGGAGGVVERAGGGRGSERAVAKLLEEKPQPLLERGAGGGVEERRRGEVVGEGPVDVGEPGPGAGDRLAEPLAGGEAVVGRAQAGEFLILGGDALEHVGRQHGADRDDVLKGEGAAPAAGSRPLEEGGGHGGRVYPVGRGMPMGGLNCHSDGLTGALGIWHTCVHHPRRSRCAMPVALSKVAKDYRRSAI